MDSDNIKPFATVGNGRFFYKISGIWAAVALPPLKPYYYHHQADIFDFVARAKQFPDYVLVAFRFME
jgi:hypothetical protein